MAWNLAKSYLEPTTVSKVEFLDDASKLLVFIERDQLFEKYGGTRKDFYDHHPTSSINSASFHTENDAGHKIVDSEDQSNEERCTENPTFQKLPSKAIIEPERKFKMKFTWPSKSPASKNTVHSSDYNSPKNVVTTSISSNDESIECDSSLSSHISTPTPLSPDIHEEISIIVEVIWSAPLEIMQSIENLSFEIISNSKSIPEIDKELKHGIELGNNPKEKLDALNA